MLWIIAELSAVDMRGTIVEDMLSELPASLAFIELEVPYNVNSLAELSESVLAISLDFKALLAVLPSLIDGTEERPLGEEVLLMYVESVNLDGSEAAATVPECKSSNGHQVV